MTTGAAARSCSRVEGGSNILSPGNSLEVEDATVNCEDHSSSGVSEAVVMVVRVKWEREERIGGDI